MNGFTYRRITGDVEQLADGALLYAGGTDLLPAIKVGLLRPDELVDIKSSAIADTIERTDDGWRIGALATLAEVQHHAELAADLAVVSEAAGLAATRQIRNRATVGGNLLQRSRCGYYRSPEVSCWLQGGAGCPARSGIHDHHAVVADGMCITTQPSDLATALVAFDAVIEVARDGSVDRRPVTDHFAAPTDERRSLHTLGDGEVVTGVVVPVRAGIRSTYLKAMDRAAWQFALVGVAAAVVPGGVRLAASGVAATPWRLGAAETVLDGIEWSDVTGDDIDRAADAATTGFAPLERNAYKLPLLRGLVAEALHRLR